MIKHIVLWTIKDEEDKSSVLPLLKSKLEALVKEIDVLKKIEVGFNYNNTPAAYDVALYSEFLTKADLDAYIIHPAHQAVGIYVKSVVKDRVVVDYEI